MSTATIQQDQKAPYQQPVDEVLAAFETDARQGLSKGEARARLERYGRNELTAEKPVPVWRKFLAHFLRFAEVPFSPEHKLMSRKSIIVWMAPT